MRGRTALLVVVWLLAGAAADAQTKPYTPRNGVLNWKAILLGGAFRVTTAIPLHGDFAKYDRVEVVRTSSVIGPDVPVTVLRSVTDRLASDFRKGGRFQKVDVVEDYEPPEVVDIATFTEQSQSFRASDPLDAPLRTAADMVIFDRQRESAARAADDSYATLVVTSEVIDYTKGNKFLQLLFLDLGNALLTLRFSYFDKVTGEELGRSVVSSDNSSKVVPSIISPRSALSGVSEGLVDQVTRRKVAGER